MFPLLQNNSTILPPIYKFTFNKHARRFSGYMFNIGDDQRITIKNSCEKAANLFPVALCTGLDEGISPDMVSHIFFEINAYEDLLKRITFNGLDTYSTEISEIERLHMQ